LYTINRRTCETKGAATAESDSATAKISSIVVVHDKFSSELTFEKYDHFDQRAQTFLTFEKYRHFDQRA